MNNKSTLVIGASINPERYSYKAIKMLRAHGIDTYAYGVKPGIVEDVTIDTERSLIPHLDTITMYISPKNQDEVSDYIIQLKPRRVIFNPGTENLTLKTTLNELGIETEEACTLVLLTTNAF